MTSSISSLVRIWKIRHSSPGCSFVRTLRVFYFPINTLVHINICIISGLIWLDLSSWVILFFAQSICSSVAHVQSSSKNKVWVACRTSELARLRSHACCEWRRGECKLTARCKSRVFPWNDKGCFELVGLKFLRKPRSALQVLQQTGSAI